MTAPVGVTVREVTVREVVRTWAPLAASWLTMALELPIVSAGMARLADPEVHLAAFGGVATPVALLIEAPIMMLLVAGTALAKDLASYRLVFRFMMVLGLLLTLLQASLAFTPLFDLVVVRLLDPPAIVIEPARLGFQLLLPWVWAIAYRRYHQGLLIRSGKSHHVSIGTALRLAACTLALLIMVALGAPGVVAAAVSMVTGVVLEAAYIGLCARQIVRGRLTTAPAVTPALSWSAFGRFYLPLALTTVMALLVQPVGSAAMSRMPEALNSLAAWPAAGGLLFMLRSLGIAYNEVVVALLERPGAYRALARFTRLLALAVTVAAALVAFTPLGRIWFGSVSGLNPELVGLAALGFAFSLPAPALDVLRNFLQGVAVNGRRTSYIGESMVAFFLSSAGLLLLGAVWGAFPALPYAMAAFALSACVQVGWLWWRNRPLLAELRRLKAAPEPQVSPEVAPIG